MGYNDFDDYLDVLGFEGSPFAALDVLGAAAELLVRLPRSELLILTPPLSPDGRELAVKMFQAMKIGESDLQHVEISDARVAVAPWFRDSTLICLILGIELAAEILALPATPALRGRPHIHSSSNAIHVWVSYSPEEVLKDVSLKRAVWDDLQEVMKRFFEMRKT